MLDGLRAASGGIAVMCRWLLDSPESRKAGVGERHVRPASRAGPRRRALQLGSDSPSTREARNPGEAARATREELEEQQAEFRFAGGAL